MTVRAWLPLILGLGLAEPALAQGFPEHGHFFGGDGMGFGAMMFLGPLFFLVFIAAVVAIVVLLIRWLGDRQSYAGAPPHMAKSPVDILKQRFARGEIDKDEFDERRRVLEE